MWNFQCVREMENAKKLEGEQMGAWPQYEKNVKELSDRMRNYCNEMKAYTDSIEYTAEEIAFNAEVDRSIAERVLRSHRHSLIVFILIFACTHIHAFAVYRNCYDRLPHVKMK